MSILINKRKCPAQKFLCKAIPACPSEAILYQVDDNEPLGGKIVIISEKCDLCGACVDACCGKAIEIQA